MSGQLARRGSNQEVVRLLEGKLTGIDLTTATAIRAVDALSDVYGYARNAAYDSLGQARILANNADPDQLQAITLLSRGYVCKLEQIVDRTGDRCLDALR